MRPRMLVAAVIALAIVGPACSQQETPPSSEGNPAVAVGNTAPSFSLESANGGRVGLTDYSRKPVLLYFSMGPG